MDALIADLPFMKQGEFHVVCDTQDAVHTLKFVKKRSPLCNQAQNELKHAQLLMKLTSQHVNLANVLNVYQLPTSITTVMEYISGDDGFDFTCQSRDISNRIDAFDIMHSQIGAAIQYLHLHNFCHTDIKLENIMVHHDTKTFKLCDYGSLRQSAWLRVLHPFCIGTSLYQPPETVLIERDAVCFVAKFDAYAFGCTLLYLLMGHYVPEKQLIRWFRDYKRNAHSPSNVIDWIRDNDILFPTKKTRSVNHRLDVLIPMLQFDPANRLM